MRVYLQSLGCRLNQSEIGDLARRFAAVGCAVVSDPGTAGVCILNTCAVTAQAECKTRRLLGKLHRRSPGARIAAIGCLATLAPETLAALSGVEWVISNAEKERTLEIVAPQIACLTPAPGNPGAPAPARRTRAFVKVQEGCDNHCTYCIVRVLRGQARSRLLGDVVAEVQHLGASGYHEVVLSGVNLGSYGQDLGAGLGLGDLLRALLLHTTLPRLRLSSVEPWDVDERLLALWADPRLCRQLHLTLQSGCDETLRRMGRRFTAQGIARLVETARAMIPGLAITTDVMVGFPGEDEEAFAECLAFVERLGFSRLHVFPFSARPGTPAAAMRGQVPLSVRRERAHRMRELGAQLAERFQRRFLGRDLPVLWEQRRADGLWRGLTDNYLPVVTASSRDLHNDVTLTHLPRLVDGVFVGEVLQ